MRYWDAISWFRISFWVAYRDTPEAFECLSGRNLPDMGYPKDLRCIPPNAQYYCSSRPLELQTSRSDLYHPYSLGELLKLLSDTHLIFLCHQTNQLQISLRPQTTNPNLPNNITQPMNNRDLQLFQKLQKEFEAEGQEQVPIEPPNPAIGFIIHAALKAVVISLFLLRGIFAGIFSNLVINQLVAVFVVVDFWFTKNVTGKKLIGVRWFFENDEFGTEKFMFQCRANEEYVSAVGIKLFWLVLMVYSIFPLIMIILGFVQAPLLFINFESIIISSGILLGGGANLFFFYQAQGASSTKQRELKKKIGVDLLRRMKLGTITSYA